MLSGFDMFECRIDMTNSRTTALTELLTGFDMFECRIDMTNSRTTALTELLTGFEMFECRIDMTNSRTTALTELLIRIILFGHTNDKRDSAVRTELLDIAAMSFMFGTPKTATENGLICY
jgi:hypothetical protein